MRNWKLWILVGFLLFGITSPVGAENSNIIKGELVGDGGSWSYNVYRYDFGETVCYQTLKGISCVVEN